MKYLVKAYDTNWNRILGNMDGQGIYRAKQYKRCKWFKALACRKTLNDRVMIYHVFSYSLPFGMLDLVCVVKNTTHKKIMKPLNLTEEQIFLLETAVMMFSIGAMGRGMNPNEWPLTEYEKLSTLLESKRQDND